MASKDFDTIYRQLIDALEMEKQADSALKQALNSFSREQATLQQLDQSRKTALIRAEEILNSVNQALEKGRDQMQSVGLSDTQQDTSVETRVAEQGQDARQGLEQAQQRARASLAALQEVQGHLLDIRATNARRRHRQRRIALGTASLGIVAAMGFGGYFLRNQSVAATQTTTPVPTTLAQTVPFTPTPQQSTPAEKTPAPTAAPTDLPIATIAATAVTSTLTQTAVVLAQTATAFAPSAPEVQAKLGIASSHYANLEATLLQHGYTDNIITFGRLHGLGTNPRDTISIWARDLDYDSSGYSYVLGDMSVLKQSTELFLQGVRNDGVVPDQIVLKWNNPYVFHKAWDSMPNLIHAVYTYVAKTGDRAFYQQHRDTVQRVGEWIAGLDSNGDGLPDRDDFPNGYYNSVTNGVRHTYALAKFYTAFNELAALERYTGNNGTIWEQRAMRLREAFHRSESGYWRDGQAWPIAWFRADNSPVTVLETFGVFEALNSGLIAPSDGARYENLIQELHNRLPDLTSGSNPVRLALGGYPAEVLLRNIDPPVPQWMLNVSVPWVVGLAAPAYAVGGYPEDAHKLLQLYMTLAQKGPLHQFAGDAQQSQETNASWDNAAWFQAVYGGHYGLTMTPAALIVQPHPFEFVSDDTVSNLSYQGAIIQLTLDQAHLTYRIQADRPIAVILRPMDGAKQLSLDNGLPSAEVSTLLQPGHVYVVEGELGS